MNPDDYLTIQQAVEALGTTNRRAIYRAIERAEAAGEGDMTVTLFGKRLVPKRLMATLKEYYFPYYSEQHQRMVKQWGAKGGAAAGVTKRKRKASRSDADRATK